MAVRFDASGDRLYTTANPPTASAYTLCGWAVLDVDRNDFSAIGSIENALTNAGVTQNVVTDSDGTTVRIYSGSGFSTGGFVPGIGTPFFWSITATSTGVNGVTGRFRTASQNTFTSFQRGGNSFTPSHIFIGNDSYSEWLNGRVWNVKQWNRALSEAELLIESYYARPMFPASLNFWWPLHNANDTADRSGNGRNPTVGGTLTTQDGPVNLWVPRRRIILPTAVVGATDLVTQESTHGHAADNLTLTTSTSLVIADCTHAHTAESLTLSTGTALTINEASHAHSADALALSTGTGLSIADSTHDHAAESLTLTTDSTLAIQDSTHSHTADQLTLGTTSGVDLVISEAVHAHSADNLALTLETTLAIAEATHSHTADGLTLTTEQHLAINDANHAHSADNVVLSDVPTLSISEATHAHAADSLALSTDSTLSIADALHDHTAEQSILSTALSLTIAEASHGHTADNLSLSDIPALVIAEATHAHTADGLVLTANISLLIAYALHAHSADQLTLSDSTIYTRAPAGNGFSRAPVITSRPATGKTTRARGASTSRPTR